MSESKTGWASMLAVSDMLLAADSVGRIEFYVTKYDNKPVELHCRCFGLPGMDKASVEALVVELNAAIAPVRNAQQQSLQNKAANQLRRFL